MIKKLLLLALLTIFVTSCKTKQRGIFGKKGAETIPKTVKKRTPKRTVKTKVYKNEDGLYPMPQDNGKFIRFEINSVEEYIASFSEVAMAEMKAFGIPASITLAQGLLESGIGKGALAKKTNNHFGIKCHKGWEGDYELHDDDAKDECFRKYNHPMYSYRDHSLFLKTRSRYAFLFELNNDDYNRWAKGLKKAGYATDKRYPDKLISLIEKYELNKFDIHKKAGVIAQKDVTATTPEQNEVVEEKFLSHTVVTGDTLYSISKKYAVSVDDLKQWNYMNDNTISIGQRLTIKSPKLN